MCVDLAGPCVAETVKGDATLHCLTIIDLETYWVELVEISEETAEEAALKFDRV